MYIRVILFTLIESNGKYLAAGGKDGSIRVYSTGQRLNLLKLTLVTRPKLRVWTG